MCWMCDHPGSSADDYLDMMRAKIRRRGWAIHYVERDRMPFAYTIGLAAAGLPELLVTGLSPQEALTMLSCCAQWIVEDDLPWLPGDTVGNPQRFVRLVEVEHPEVHLGVAVRLQGPVTALQLVWHDAAGHGPWCPDFNGGRGGQAVLGLAPFDEHREAG